jgi:uncharacterized protein (DUF1501 family)
MSHIITPPHFHITRRGLLGGLGATLTLSAMRPARAAVAFPQRLVILNLLGALDGMSAVVPYGDPNLAGLRAPLIPPPVGQTGGMFDLGGFYGLNPAMPNLYAMYQAGQMLAVHAVGGIASTRSHFVGQTALQCGDATPTVDGWMNRLVGLLSTVPGGVEAGLSFGAGNPQIAQGAVPIGAWAPCSLAQTPNLLAALIGTLDQTDPLIGFPIQSGFADRALFTSWLHGNGTPNGQSPLQVLMRAAGIFLNSAGGPAVAVLQSDSMDTHADQVLRLAPLLSDVDAAIALLAAGSGAAWANTVVVTITEFGRTAAVNGTTGTDHGTGFAMFLAGGAVAGGRVIATWPGLAPNELYQGRDLAATTDVRSVIMGVLRDHLGVNANGLATIFPNAGVAPLGGLVNG